MAPSKQLTPAELAALEHAFAAEPSSDAFRPLTEAYLAAGRFMEAMVVCKKGVKAHPTDPAARVLLANVYAGQGKDKKALEELQAILESFPQDVPANRMAGGLYLKLGEKEKGTGALQRAALTAPNDAETLELMKKWGVAMPTPPPPPPRAQPSATVSAQAPVAGAPPPRAAPPTAPAARPAQAAQTAAPAPAARRATVAPAPPATEQMLPTPPPTQKGSERNLDYARELAEKYTTQEYHLITGKTGEVPVTRRKGPGLKTSLALVVVLAAALASWGFYTSWRKARDSEIAKFLKDAGELIAKDSNVGYKKASELCEQVLKRDPDSLGGHSFLAYIDVLRWGELGEGDAFKEEAQKHLQAARKQSERHSHLIAADAYLRFFQGDLKGAIQTLEGVLKGPEGGTSGLLYGALGIIQMQGGDLDAAKESLTTARKFADRDVRVNQMLAEQYRRRGPGNEVQAITFYEAALRLAPDHVPSLIGVSQMFVSREQYDEALRRIEKVLQSSGDASPRQQALAHVIKSGVLYAKGKSSEGAAEEQQALLLDQSNPDIRALIARRLMREGNPGGAVEEIQRAIDMDPQRIAFYVDLANALMQKKDGGAKQAIEALQKATGRFPDNARMVKLLGDAFRIDGDLERARTEYEKAIAVEKRYPEARMALSRIWRDRKEWGKALDELEKAIKEYGESTSGGAQARVEMAEIEAERGGTPTAIDELYKKALRADSTNCSALWALGRERANSRSNVYDKDLARQMLTDYARNCPRAPHVNEAVAIVRALR